ncbi:MAG: hypothetical protein JJU34_01165 [Lunatimonas sp.]|uniref:hypothetical protein n=1 Tax=Lunatimonas sp. TaxID=2060141 RepID=UPI00263A915D|nr:hypothetical protein [Lunatimonas sp.]MCC5935865.1 hypothetical protein [Lunatimonas sp.]
MIHKPTSKSHGVLVHLKTRQVATFVLDNFAMGTKLALKVHRRTVRGLRIIRSG